MEGYSYISNSQFFPKTFSLYILSLLVFQSCIECSSKNAVKHPKQIEVFPGPGPVLSSSFTFDHGIGCGSVPMHSNHIVKIQSSNFEIGANYFNNEGCTWTFASMECGLSIFCPCFDIPTSLGCFEDYLKISHQQFSFQGTRFCGKSYPVGIYRATSNSLTVQFKSDYKLTGKGFLCYVRCTAPGKADPEAPPANCSLNSKNPYGFPDSS